MGDVNIDKYCEDPSKYGSLPKKTITYYNSICTARKQLSKGGDNHTGKKVGVAIAKLPLDMIKGIFTPEGLEMLAIFEGAKIGLKALLGGTLRVIARGVGKEILEAASEAAAKEGALVVSNAILTRIIGEAAEESLLAAVSSLPLEAIPVIGTVIELILFIVQT